MNGLFERHAELGSRVDLLNARMSKLAEKATAGVHPHERLVASQLFLRQPIRELGEVDRFRPSPRLIRLAVHYLNGGQDFRLRDSQERIAGLLSRQISERGPSPAPVVRAVRILGRKIHASGFVHEPAVMYALGSALLRLGRSAAAALLLVAAAHFNSESQKYVADDFNHAEFHPGNAAKGLRKAAERDSCPPALKAAFLRKANELDPVSR